MDHNEFMKLAIPIAVNIAKEEGLTDEDAIVVRANDIVIDAELETPLSEAGGMVKARVADNTTGIPSPIQMDKIQFDYTDLQERTTTPAILDTIKMLADFPALVPKFKPSEDDKIATAKAYDDASLKILHILNEHKVGFFAYGGFWGSLKAMIGALEDIVKQQQSGHNAEIMSRILGAKNPGTDKFDGNFATYDDLVNALMKVRKDTGDNREDFFPIIKK